MVAGTVAPCRTTFAAFLYYPELLAVTRLSILLPYWGHLARLEGTLVSVLQNRPEACDVVVVLNRAYDDPYELHDEVTFVQAEPHLGLLASAHRGLSACRAPVVHLLGCGMEVGAGWTDAAVSRFDDPSIAAVAPLIARSDAPQRIVSAGIAHGRGGRIRRLAAGQLATAAVRPGVSPSAPDALAGFYRRDVLARVAELGAVAEAEMDEIDLAAALDHDARSCVVEPRCRVYASDDLTRTRGSVAAGAAAERCFWRWLPERGWATALLAHGLLVTEQGLAAVVRPSNLLGVLGHLGGAMQLGTHGRQRRAIRRWHSADPGAHRVDTDHSEFSPDDAEPRIMSIEDHRPAPFEALDDDRRCA